MRNMFSANQTRDSVSARKLMRRVTSLNDQLTMNRGGKAGKCGDGGTRCRTMAPGSSRAAGVIAHGERF